MSSSRCWGTTDGHVSTSANASAPFSGGIRRSWRRVPSPILTADLRARMGETAVRAASACRYANAGTVEFLVDGARKFYSSWR